MKKGTLVIASFVLVVLLALTAFSVVGLESEQADTLQEGEFSSEEIVLAMIRASGGDITQFHETMKKLIDLPASQLLEIAIEQASKSPF